MRGQGSALRSWLTGIGGLLIFLSIWGFFVRNLFSPQEVVDASGFMGPIFWHFAAPWFWYHCLGMVLIYFGNPRTQTGHWHSLVEGLSAQPIAFYDSVEKRLRERGVPSARMDLAEAKQRGPLGSSRLLLRIGSSYHVFDFMAVPYGNDFGFSWRCYERMKIYERALTAMPIWGWLVYFLFFRFTPYMQDKGLFFQDAVHEAIKSCIRQETEHQGLRGLTDQQFKPIVADMRGH